MDQYKPMTSRPLLPGRFLAMAAHLGMLMRMGGDPPKLPSGDPEPGFWGALGGSLALLGVEFLGFFSGVSMFHPGQSLASLAAHAGVCGIWGGSQWILGVSGIWGGVCGIWGGSQWILGVSVDF
ncbi:transmembrane protein 107-like isoform X5 [Vidua chalybeata]|uniref:transmembrane protein 107-like isoform X5 n=1 Tax=Vidua chalybeata TaxID=81927 RepID=UPI0023A87072|nr:transmembrane protein 107-like isoform X5 [Vidua chalybeata]